MSDGEDRDGRSTVARGYILASRASSIGLQMAIPAGFGWWVDSKWKTAPWLTITGVVLGFILAMVELIRLAKESERSNLPSRNRGAKKKPEDEPR